jgi:intracellular sulfur oxidation DsrE/DsrF family protein
MDDRGFPASRRDFLSLAATAAVGFGAGVPVARRMPVAQDPSTEFTRWLDTIPGTHKQLYDMPEVNQGIGLVWSWAFLTTGASAYGLLEKDLGVVIVLRHNAIPLALNDAAWAKYKLGEVFKIEDPDTRAPARRNPFYHMPGAFAVPEAALEKLIARGVKVAVCNLAITISSGMVAQKKGLQHEDVNRDWIDAVFAGVQVVPSGVVACNGAASRGCAYIFAG